MNDLFNILGGVLGIALLYYGAEWVVDSGVQVARRLRIPPLVVGLTLVSFATSAPELAVSVSAALQHNGDISLANVIGSNICNIGLILGLCAMVTPIAVNPQVLRLDVPVMIVSAVALALASMSLKGIPRPVAAAFLVAGIVYCWVNVKGASKMPQPPETETGEGSSVQEKPDGGLAKISVMIVAGIAALVIGAKLLVNCAVVLASLCHVSDAVIGLTVVAVGTSLPELVTSLVAALRKQNDISLGNVVGSNIFNILGILGISPLIAPIHAPEISLVDNAVLLLLSVALFPIVKSGQKVSRAEGVCLFAVYAAYTAWLIVHGKVA